MPLEPPQHPHSSRSAKQTTVDLLVNVPSKLFAYVSSREEGLLQQSSGEATAQSQSEGCPRPEQL